jgi:hypothetical protein
MKELNQEIEERIEMEIVVDAYNEWERAMGWACYLQQQMTFPFKAKCIKTKNISPLSVGEIVEVTDIDSSARCEEDMFAKIRWQNKEFCVPLIQLEGIDIDQRTKQGMDDWNYWVDQGYDF